MIRKIIIGSIGSQLLPHALNVVLLGFGTTIISLILVLNYSYNQKVEKDLRDVDIVVGAKGSPLQLILSSIYHLDQAKGNISVSEVDELKKNKYVESITPLSYGDYYKGYKILGTDLSYLERYNGIIAEGNIFKNDFEVVMGAKIAENNNLSVGSKFVGNHGLGEEATAHYNHPYTIVGTLEPTGSAIDYLFICDINSVDIIHQSDRGNGDKEITAALIELNDPTALHNLPQSINKHTTLLAAIPTEEINKLSYISGLGTTLLEGIAWSIVFLSAMSIFITVYRSVRSRRYEMSIMRMMGATRFTLIIIILLETWLTTAAGYLLGLAVSRIGIWILQNKIIHQATLTIGYQLTPTEKYLFPVLIVFSTISVVLPMIYAFRLDISKILAEE